MCCSPSLFPGRAARDSLKRYKRGTCLSRFPLVVKLINEIALLRSEIPTHELRELLHAGDLPEVAAGLRQRDAGLLAACRAEGAGIETLRPLIARRYG